MNCPLPPPPHHPRQTIADLPLGEPLPLNQGQDNGDAAVGLRSGMAYRYRLLTAAACRHMRSQQHARSDCSTIQGTIRRMGRHAASLRLTDVWHPGHLLNSPGPLSDSHFEEPISASGSRRSSIKFCFSASFWPCFENSVTWGQRHRQQLPASGRRRGWSRRCS